MKLTKHKGRNAYANKLTEGLANRLVLCFSFKLENKYSFEKLKHEDLKEFQEFLDCIHCYDVDEVERRYKRKTDTNDWFVYHDNKFQVIHFGKNGSKFRIHGFYANGNFHVIRLDRNHTFHRV